MQAEEIHNFNQSVGYAAAAGHRHLDIRQFKSEIAMYKFLKIFLLKNPAQLVEARSFSVSHNTVMGTHNTGKKTEADHTLTVIVLQAFIIDQRNLFSKNRLE